ncbi:hypothetical protein BSL78_22551 [Apostichopus japonicus]|uniref:AB hydrolase-1 domain-containing protein n=1 Tax=Stichopus japonicus TaxID=307972 RepID=A0A2G8JXZ1_STIJA|nr:hypothetical protein BSL78_22551 [Apostichopus japonicus]
MAPSQSPSARRRKGEKPAGLRGNVTKKSKSSASQPEPTGPVMACLWTTMKFFFYGFCVLLVPPVLNLAALNKEESVLSEYGLPYDIGWDQTLFLNCSGKGSPTVILESPIGQSSEVWFAVQPALAEVTRNITEEDRKRRGPESTVERMVNDLHYLVTSSSDQPKPFIIVGAELGALVARFYAQLYEEEVSDIVLIDPLVEVLLEEDGGVWNEMWLGHILPSSISMQLSAATGLTRLGLILKLLDLPIKAHNVPEEVVLRQKHLMCRPGHQSASVDEHYFINESFAQIRTAYKVKPFPSSVSVTVVTGNYHDDELPNILNEAWESSVEFLMSIHQNAKPILINGSDGHMIYRKPKEVIDIVKKLIRKWREVNQRKNRVTDQKETR